MPNTTCSQVPANCKEVSRRAGVPSRAKLVLRFGGNPASRTGTSHHLLSSMQLVFKEWKGSTICGKPNYSENSKPYKCQDRDLIDCHQKARPKAASSSSPCFPLGFEVVPPMCNTWLFMSTTADIHMTHAQWPDDVWYSSEASAKIDAQFASSR